MHTLQQLWTLNFLNLCEHFNFKVDRYIGNTFLSAPSGEVCLPPTEQLNHLWYYKWFQASESEERQQCADAMLAICSSFNFDDGSKDFEFLPTSWIKSYLSDPKTGNLEQFFCCKYVILVVHRWSTIKALVSKEIVGMAFQCYGLNFCPSLDLSSLFVICKTT